MDNQKRQKLTLPFAKINLLNSGILAVMMKQTIKLLKNPPILLIIGIFISLFILGIKVVLQQDQYVTVEIIAAGGDWWQTLPQTPHWLADAVTPGAVEYTVGGKKLAEILETKKYQEDVNKILWAKVRLLVTPDKARGDWRFQQMPLAIGSTLTINPNSVKLTGSVIAIDGIGRSGEYKNLLVTIKLYDRYPWYADAIKVSHQTVDGQGNATAKVLGKKVDLAETIVTTADGRVLPRLDPLKRDITLELKIQVVEREGLLYYNQIQAVKIGNRLWIQTKDINLSEANILDIREDR